MNIPGWVVLGAVGVLALIVLELTKPDNTPPPPTTMDAFFDAAAGGNLQTIQSLLENGIDVNIKDATFGHTALIVAARRGHLQIIEVLLAKGADVNATDNYGNTALGWARKTSRADAEAVVDMLKQAGAVEPRQASLGMLGASASFSLAGLVSVHAPQFLDGVGLASSA